MGIFDFLTKPSDEKLTKKLVNYVYNSIQADKGVRVEDAICVMSTIKHHKSQDQQRIVVCYH